MCPTPLGRLQTRAFVLIPPAILAVLLGFIFTVEGETFNEGFILLIGIFLIQGIILDILFYPRVIKWQPPWLSFLLACGEFVIVYLLAQVLELGKETSLGNVEAAVWYWVAWSIAQVTRIVTFPIFSLTWVESGGEFRHTGWSISPEQEPLAAVPNATPVRPGESRLVREFSTVNQVPNELQGLPSPSGVHRRPQRA